MHRRTFTWQYAYLVVSLLTLTSRASLAAEETPAANQVDPPDVEVIHLDVPQGRLLSHLVLASENNLNSGRFVVSRLQLAANTDLIGAEVTQVDDVLRSHLELGEGKGLVVTAVGDDGPAAKAGIMKNDVLIAVGGEEISSLEAFRNSLEASAEKPIAIGLIRAGKKQSIDVTPRSIAARMLLDAIHETTAEPKYWLGLGLAAADDTLRSQLSLSDGQGLVVTSVEDKSPAAKAGVMVNDVLLKLDGTPLSTIESLAEQLQTIADKSVPLDLLRRGKPATLTVSPEKHADSALRFSEVAIEPVHWAVADVVYTNDITSQLVNLTAAATRPDVAQQLSALEAQVKQLEASLAALRGAIEQSAQPAPSGEEKE